MITKIILTGSFSNYELHCNSSDGSIMIFNHKDSTTHSLGFYRSGRLRFHTNTYKTLRKWMERKSKSITQSTGLTYNGLTVREAVDAAKQVESTQADLFFNSLKGEVRAYKLKEGFKEELK